MEHRKRHLMQHKTEISILLQLAIANRKKTFKLNESDSKKLIKSLASEAIKSASNNDRIKNPSQLIA